MAQERKHHAQGQLGHGLRGIARGIADRDALPAGGIQIDMINAGKGDVQEF